jgi:hypothetical protein
MKQHQIGANMSWTYFSSPLKINEESKISSEKGIISYWKFYNSNGKYVFSDGN